MLFIFLQLDLLGKFIEISVHTDTHIAALSGLLENLDMLALPSADHRSQKLDLCPLRQSHDLVHHLVHILLFDLFSAFRAVGNADPRVEQTKIIVNLRDGSHGGTRVAVCGFLVDGNRRREAFNALHIRLFHLSQKLTGIGRKRLHIPALSLCIDRIKGQGRFSRTTQARQNHKLISRDIHTDLFQVVDVCSPDADHRFLIFFCTHSSISCKCFFKTIIWSRSRAASSKFSSAAACFIRFCTSFTAASSSFLLMDSGSFSGFFGASSVSL